MFNVAYLLFCRTGHSSPTNNADPGRSSSRQHNFVLLLASTVFTFFTMKAFAILPALVALLGTMKLIGVSAIPSPDLGNGSGPCDFDAAGTSGQSACGATDGYVGSNVIYEDDYVRIWNFTLAPGQSTSMHRHDHDYHFVAISPTQLEVYGEDGLRLFDFRAEGTFG